MNLSATQEQVADDDFRPSITWDVLTDPSLSDREFRLLAILNVLAEDKPYCQADNQELAARSGKSITAVREILRELESCDPPWIRRIPDESTHGRAGIVLLRRTGPRMPVWPADRPLSEAADLLPRLTAPQAARY